jgi:hypothetical protein
MKYQNGETLNLDVPELSKLLTNAHHSKNEENPTRIEIEFLHHYLENFFGKRKLN